MSGKPASVGAPRAGAPRVLVYVAERQLEPGAAPRHPPPQLPHTPQPSQPLHTPHNQFTPHIDHNERTQPNTIFYKVNETDPKLNSYGPDGSFPRSDFYPLNQQFLKEPSIKIEDGKNTHPANIIRRDCSKQLGSEYGVEYARVPVELSEIVTYPPRCPGNVDTMPTLQSVALCHGHNQLTENIRVQSEGNELVGKSYMNYQFLEQSVSHQSIVNQSINILNQQVGVNKGIPCDSDSVGAPQLVRTPDGVVLAVLPSSVLSQQAEATELSRTHSETTQTITVPLGWRRVVNGVSVIYVSPSGTPLSNLPQLREYLQTSGTCKCGLPCPLRPETAFNFDPKVVSIPYQAASGAELTKLCNHKRKLLATLQARAQSPATPPPQIEQKKVTGTEVAVLKKKMRKRPNYPQNVNVSQLLVQRDRQHDFKAQDGDLNRTSSPGMNQRPNNCQPGLPGFSHNALTSIPQDNEVKEPQLQRSSHYLTVSSGWITQQQENTEKTTQNAHNVGLPVIGTNGQIIGVNTAYNKHISMKNVMPEDKDDKKEQIQTKKEEESQIFCGLNQPLTPEVMQKINEQQQLFIQQNQKQIEMAMKGYRSQMVENQNKQGQYVPQGQLVIQNGAVVKTNPAKTPPWQVKRNDSSSSSLTSPSPKPQNLDFDDSNANTSEESNSYNTFHNEQAMSQAMCSRVPPLPQHYSMMGQQWPVVENKKKSKGSKGGKKKNIPTENKVMMFGNNGMRIMQDSKCKELEIPNNAPSFMEDPSAFLAQQTALLNNTISRQVGVNSSYDGNQYENTNNCYLQNQVDKCKQPNKHFEMHNVYRNKMVPNLSPSPNNTPDSSVLPDKKSDVQCCKGCNLSKKGNQEFAENQIRMKNMKPNMYKMEMDNSTSSPKHGFDDNPVTSSTFVDRSPMGNESCGPIQAGTVSTSNVSPIETLQLPEPSPTLSNSSRNTDTPLSGGSNSQIPGSTYPISSPAYSNSGREFSNPPTPGSSNTYPYNSPGPPHSISGTQMMHFISNHNVNKNLMEVDNISMVGVKPGIKCTQEIIRSDSRKRYENTMPGYCPPPHLGGGPATSLVQACYVQTFVTTMSGFSVTRDTVTSVLAGRANTATTSINASSQHFIRPPPPPSVNLATTYAIPNNQPDPFLNSVNLPTSYPLHIAGTTAQNMITKSPMEMVQNVIGGVSKPESSASQTLTQVGRRMFPTTPGQILISSTGQIMVSNSHMPPPPPKTSSSSPLHSNALTSVSTTITQVVPAVAGVQPIVNQPTVVVNALQAPFAIPQMMAVDGQVVQQNAVLPQLVGGIVSGQNENSRQIDVKSGQSYVQGVAMLSPESLKKRNKKKKGQANITSVLQIAAPQQNHNNLMVHHTSPQHNTSPQFSPRGFQLSPNNNISPTAPMLQALTIVPGKSGTSAHIVMNGQGNTGNFGSQQIITNTSPSQQINLLQPVNLINNASGVMPNFPAFQQFLVPNLGGMLMTPDGTAIIQDNSTGMPMQLQLQTVNGQNVLTPVQNPGVFTGTNGGVVIRAQNQQGKIIQSQHSPGAQFLSPNSQVMMSSPNFNGQLSPLLANLSPTNVTFNTSPHQARSSNVQAQEFISTNQIGQTLMVPLSPKQASLASAANNRSNSTFVQQNTTIVQQQTTLVSNSHNGQMTSLANNIQGGNSSRLSIDPSVLLAQKSVTNQKRNYIEMPLDIADESKEEKHFIPSNEDLKESPESYAKIMNDFGVLGQGFNHVRHSVSTQTLVNQQRGKSPNSQAVSGSSPPDTTTHSPLGALEAAASPRVYSSRCMSTQGNYADTTTKSPEPADANSSAMVQCVSSSEQDIAESRDPAWHPPRNEFTPDTDAQAPQNVMQNMQMMRHNRPYNIESTEMHYNRNVSTPQLNQQMMPIPSNYYDRAQSYKRKNEFSDGSNYRNDKFMRTNYNMVHGPKESEFELSPDKRHYAPSGSSSDNSIQKVFDRHLGSGDDTKSEDESKQEADKSDFSTKFEVGELVWGPVKGYASWPGKLEGREDGGRWIVKWFGGDRAPSAVDDCKLLTLTEGLEAHHAARTKHRKSRKLNTLLENAIQEAMSELDKKSDVTSDHPIEAEVSEEITDTPKRKKQDKLPKNKHHKKSLVKTVTTQSKTSDGSRLRSTR